MKIVCDACQAKYSISDDKVQGKVFKIRCKKCSNIIVVRGGAGAAEQAPPPAQEKDTRVYDYGYEGGDQAPTGDDAVWHVVINQDQVGPMTAVDVQRRYASGEIDGETYIWREGFADWLPLAQVDTFASLASLASAPPVAHRSAGSEAVASMFGSGDDGGTARSDPGDLFAAASASAARDDDGGDLFGAKPAAPAAQSSASGAKLRGERNENSVLFSLNNLAQLASDKPAPAPTHSSGSSTSMAAASSGSGGEGSGLIDIRSMASAYLGAPGSAAKPASSGIGSIDDLPVFGGGGFSEPAVIVPIAARPAGNSKLLYALIGSVGLLAVAAVVVVVVLLRGGDKPTQTASTDKADSAATGDRSADSDKGGDRAGGDKATDPATDKTTDRAAAPAGDKPADKAGDKPADKAGDKPADKAGDKPAESPAVAKGEPKSGDAKPAKPEGTKVAIAEPPTEPKRAAPPAPRTPPATAPRGKTPSPAVTAAPKEPPPPAKEPAAAKGDCDEVSCVLSNYEGACCAKFKKGGKAAPAAAAKSGDLPENLDRGLITEGIGKVKPRAQACSSASSAHGTVKVSVKVSPEGRVTSVTVKSTPDDALGNCVVAAVQKATFAKTQAGGSFSYPFTF